MLDINFDKKLSATKPLSKLISSFTGGDEERETPDPIPNSEVKTLLADGTTHKSVEE